MALVIDAKLYVQYLKRAYARIHEKEDYITELDQATGDGDHWSNMDKGFTKIVDQAEVLEGKNLGDLFKQVGMTMMSVVGGSSGVLYGGAYLAASKTLAGKEEASLADLYTALETMLTDMMNRGKAERGWKTMIDALAPAVDAFKAGLEAGTAEADLLEAVAVAAENGAEATREMEAIRGRANYQANKGVGHLDPGAVTMAYQIRALADTLREAL